MSSSTIAKASRIDRAVERLEAAVERLDLALTEDVRTAMDDVEAEMVERLRNENAELRELNRAAADRLAGAVQRLQALMSNGKGG